GGAVAAAATAASLWPARRALAAGERVLEEAKSPYNHIVVAETDQVRTMYFVVDGTYYIESRLDRAQPLALDLDYTRTMMSGFLVQPAIKRLLMIGFGGGTISNYLFRRFPGLEVDAVDIDGEVIRLARKYFDVPHDPRYRTHAADGRLFVERSDAKARWDMIMLDAFRGVFVPFHLKTREYYAMLRSRLAAEGVVVANLHNATPMYAHDRVTFEEAFPSGYAFMAESSRQTTYVASASARQLGAYELRANARKLDPHFDFDLPGLAARWYLGRDFDPNVEVLRDDFPEGQTPGGAERHNLRCEGDDCPYRMK
ncbi:MAG: fused MFS/spermidine synthase, partial [Deltaproteobacteria bacterium]|nr:fused MFS/spermidine synthase [Nannocystaceae bacterium]